MNEKNEFHPVVAEWLTNQGYIYEHEAIMPDYGVVDFWAKDAEGNSLLVECKPYDVKLGIVQVTNYRIQVPGSKAMVATFDNSMRPRFLDTAKKYDVQIVTFPIPLSSEMSTVQYAGRYYTEAKFIEFLQKKYPELFSVTQITQVQEVAQVDLPANGLAARIAALPIEHQALIEQAIQACEGTSIIPLDAPQEYYTRNGTR